MTSKVQAARERINLYKMRQLQRRQQVKSLGKNYVYTNKDGTCRSGQKLYNVVGPKGSKTQVCRSPCKRGTTRRRKFPYDCVNIKAKRPSTGRKNCPRGSKKYKPAGPGCHPLEYIQDTKEKMKAQAKERAILKEERIKCKQLGQVYDVDKDSCRDRKGGRKSSGESLAMSRIRCQGLGLVLDTKTGECRGRKKVTQAQKEALAQNRRICERVGMKWSSKARECV